jgi:aminoglycoside phosphotransferase family enzyme
LSETAALDHGLSRLGAGEPTLTDKVAFLSRPDAYPHPVGKVILRETHMSWVFLAGDRVYKLKKPVRFAYLDFSSLERREAACRAEVSLNRRLAANVYIGVAPLALSDGSLAIGGAGAVTDWLVVMHRLNDRRALDQVLLERRLEAPHLDRLVATLVRFYRRARPVFVSAGAHLSEWSRSLAANRRVLLDPRFGLSPAPIRRIDWIERRFVTQCGGELAARVHRRRIVDGHGDLRPEHIWLNREVRIIDCLEFNPRLRVVDPLDEIAFLDLECERLGAAWAGRYIKARVTRGLNDALPIGLYGFYRSYRATLRARLAIAHLCEPNPRTPEKWPRLARAYLAIATHEAASLEALLRTRQGRRERGRRGGARSSRRAGTQWAGSRACPKRRSSPAGTAARYR